MQLIAVDIGNSSTKIGFARNAVAQKSAWRDLQSQGDDLWTSRGNLPNENPIALLDEDLKLDQAPATWAVSSVNSVRAQSLGDWVATHRPSDRFHLIAQSDVDLQSDVQSRKQLGRDRLIAAWMAIQLNDNAGPAIVVDAGTAVTVDFVDAQLVFQGGTISPGADSNLRQLAQNTDALPSLSQKRRDELLKDMELGAIGKSTEQAIFNGVYQFQISGIVGIVAAISKQLASPPVVFATGGGIGDISKFLPESWTQVPDLVLRGAFGIGLQFESKPAN